MTTARQQYIIGVDLGGTNIVAGALTVDGSRHLAMRSIPTNSAAGDEAVAERIVALVEGVFLDAISETGATRNDFIGIGVGAPGPLDREHGIVLVAPNLGWKDFPLRDRIQSRLKSADDARQRRELRDVRRMVAGRGARRPERRSGSRSAPASAADSS